MKKLKEKHVISLVVIVVLVIGGSVTAIAINNSVPKSMGFDDDPNSGEITNEIEPVTENNEPDVNNEDERDIEEKATKDDKENASSNTDPKVKEFIDKNTTNVSNKSKAQSKQDAKQTTAQSTNKKSTTDNKQTTTKSKQQPKKQEPKKQQPTKKPGSVKPKEPPKPPAPKPKPKAEPKPKPNPAPPKKEDNPFRKPTVPGGENDGPGGTTDDYDHIEIPIDTIPCPSC